jgi:hypothetical protein
MLSKYGEIAEDAALMRGNHEFCALISTERQSDPCISLKQLSVNGTELIKSGIEARALGGIMANLLEAVIIDPSINKNDKLKEMATAIFKNPKG